MIDLGLTTGIKDLWQENLLRDYTVIAEGREFQVHKVVLAAVSKYFKAMLSEGYMESKMDRVEVKGFSADIVSKLLEFIYTGEEGVITGDEIEILRCAMYLQIPLVSEFCVKKLMEDLNVHNCLEILSALIEFTYRKEVKEVKRFIQRNWGVVMENCSLETLSSDTVQVLMDCWKTCEWDMFLFVKNWICQDYGNCIGSVNDLMSRVRFCLIGPDELQAIMQMDIYHKTEGPWQDLVMNAVKYHQLPINLKVLEKSEQSRVKTEPLPAFFCIMSCQDKVTLFGSNKRNKWKQHEQKGFTAPGIGKYPYSVCLEVNNFLIVCTTGKHGQKWHVFDPRTLTWCAMTNMENPKREFALVHHNDHLYIVGGKYLAQSPVCETEQYSFLSNKWSSIHAMPVKVRLPAACVLGDTLYVSGGRLVQEDEDYKGSDGFYSLHLSAGSHTWKRKAPCLMKCYAHEMSVLNRRGEKTLFIIDDLDFQFYSPSMDQWSSFTNRFKPLAFDTPWLFEGTVVVSGNSVYILNMNTMVDDESWDSDESAPWRYVCWKLLIPEEGERLMKVDMQDLPEQPDSDGCIDPDVCGAMLAVPPHKV